MSGGYVTPVGDTRGKRRPTHPKCWEIFAGVRCVNQLVIVGLEFSVGLSLGEGWCECWTCASMTLDYTLQYVEGRAVLAHFTYVR